MVDSMCDYCQYCKVVKGKARGVMDCDPPEEYCEYGMDENYGTAGGCFRYEYGEEYDD